MSNAKTINIRNITTGPRGLHTASGMVCLEAGETRSVRLTEVMMRSAESTGYFGRPDPDDQQADPARAARYAELAASLTDDDLTDGKPKTSALNALLDEDEAKFDAAERDALHEANAQ